MTLQLVDLVTVMFIALPREVRGQSVVNAAVSTLRDVQKTTEAGIGIMSTGEIQGQDSQCSVFILDFTPRA